MKNRLMAVAILAFLIIGMSIPMMSAGTDALDESDYRISIPGTAAPDKDVDVTIGNGMSYSWDVYVVNTSDKILDVTFNTSLSTKDMVISEKPKNTLLLSYNENQTDYYTSGVFTISVDKLSESHENEPVQLYITLTDVTDKQNPRVVTVNFYVTIESIYDSGEYNKFLGMYENTLPSPFDSSIIPFIATVLFWMIVAWVLCLLIAPSAARFLDKRTVDDDREKFEKIITKLILALVFLVTINQGLDILGASISLKAEVLNVSSLFCIAVTLVIAWEIFKLVVEGILSRFEDEEDSAIDLTLLPLFYMIGKIVFWIAGIAAILGAFGVDLTGILVSAGVVSLGITMGAQNVLSQFFSGIVILMTRPFKRGDFLKINGTVYIVRKVKVMFTEFYSWDKDQITTMPNNAVTAATIVNLTKEDEAYRLYIYFSVAFGTDLKKAEEVMLNVANKSPIVLHDDQHQAPNVRITNFLASGIELRLGVTTHDFGSSITDGSILRAEVYQAFVDNDIKVPYNRLEVTMLNDCFQGERRPGDMVED